MKIDLWFWNRHKEDFYMLIVMYLVFMLVVAFSSIPLWVSYSMSNGLFALVIMIIFIGHPLLIGLSVFVVEKYYITFKKLVEG